MAASCFQECYLCSPAKTCASASATRSSQDGMQDGRHGPQAFPAISSLRNRHCVPCPPAGGKPFCRPASITYTRKSLFGILTLQLRFKAQGLDMGSGTDRKGRSKSERTSLVYRVLYCKRASRFASAHFCGTRSSSRKETELPYSLGSMPMWAIKLP
jgi:hypothetical protein